MANGLWPPEKLSAVAKADISKDPQSKPPIKTMTAADH